MMFPIISALPHSKAGAETEKSNRPDRVGFAEKGRANFLRCGPGSVTLEAPALPTGENPTWSGSQNRPPSPPLTLFEHAGPYRPRLFT